MTTDYVAIPRDSLTLHKYVTIVSDVMLQNNIPLLITMSHGIKFETVKQILSLISKQLKKNFKIIMDL